MFKMPKKTEYALPENIGNTDLFVGRKKEFDFFLGDWYQDLEGNFAQNQAIISRRKKGKTAFLQRFFNILWSARVEKKDDELQVIPFYYSIKDTPNNLGSFSMDFFTTCVRCYVSYMKRDKEMLELESTYTQIEKYIEDEYIKEIHKELKEYERENAWEPMWQLASRMPVSIARLKNVKIVQIIDEFQNINEYIYDHRGRKIEEMSGTYMQVAEMREAPVIVSGSEVNWLLKIVSSLTGRFQTYNLENLPKEEAEEAIEKYANFRKTKINKETKEKIWNLTKGDPLYIKALFLSRYNTKKDYTSQEPIIEVYEKEINPGGEIYTTWMEYMYKTFDTVNKWNLRNKFLGSLLENHKLHVNSKRIMLYLFQQGKERTRNEIKKDLNLKYSDEELETKLEALISGDLISHGRSAYRYTTTRDKTYELFFRNKYQDEIDNFVPDIKKELRKIMGKDNYTKGKFQEFLIKERLKKAFNLKDITENGENATIIPTEIEERTFIKMGLKTYEIDLIVTGKMNKSTLKSYIDIKNTQNKYGKREFDRWLKITEKIRKEEERSLFMTYSETGYTKGTKEKLKEKGVLIIKNAYKS